MNEFAPEQPSARPWAADIGSHTHSAHQRNVCTLHAASSVAKHALSVEETKR